MAMKQPNYPRAKPKGMTDAEMMDKLRRQQAFRFCPSCGAVIVVPAIPGYEGNKPVPLDAIVFPIEAYSVKCKCGKILKRVIPDGKEEYDWTVKAERKLF